MDGQILNALEKIIGYKTVEGEAKPDMPFGEENYRCLEETLKLCASFGMKTVNLDGYCGYAEIGEGELVGILCHLDVVPTNDKWDTDPYTLTVKDGYIYGRGVVDDKGPAILNIFALKELLKTGTPTKRIRLIFGCNEESGMGCMEYYKAHAEIPKIAYAPDAEFPLVSTEKGIADVQVYISKPYGLTYIRGGQRKNIVPDYCEAAIHYLDVEKDISKVKFCTVEKVEDYYILKANGKSAHASTPELGDNAIVKVLKDLFAITGKRWYLNLAKKAVNDGSGIGLKSSDFSGEFTVNLGRIDTECELLKLWIDMRYPVTMSEEKVKEGARKFDKDAKITLSAPLNVDENSNLVKTLLDVYKETTGSDKKPLRIGGGTYARAIPCTAVAFGPVESDEPCNVHDANENISLESFEKAYNIYKTALKRLCF